MVSMMVSAALVCSSSRNEMMAEDEVALLCFSVTIAAAAGICTVQMLLSLLEGVSEFECGQFRSINRRVC